jgi:hypothetical protein
VPYHGYFWLDSLLRKLFGKQEGEKLSNAIGVLAGVAGLVVSIANQWSWFAVVSALLVTLSGADLVRERRHRPDPSEDHGLVGDIVSNPPKLNPFHHEPLPPFPSRPDDEAPG